MRASVAFDDGMPRARRAFAQRMLRAVLRQPAATIGYSLAFALSSAIVVNALYLQAGPHPAPLIAGNVFANSPKETTGSLTAASPRPVVARVPAADPAPQRTRGELITSIQRELAARGFYDGAIDGIYGPKMDAGIREFVQTAGLRVSGEPSERLLEAIARSKLRAARRTAPPEATPAAARQEAKVVPTPPSRRIVAVQRALSDFGYGQLRLTGVFDDATKAAIERFERERKLPVRGQISDRLLRELAAVTGRPLE